MWKKHSGFKKPKGKSKSLTIWRYMDFTKFVSLLETKSLFFSRVDMLLDPFEGSVTEMNLKARNAFFNYVRRSGLPEEAMIQLRIDEPDLSKKWRKSVFVNCWGINKHESAAMWKLYLKSNEGIAIKSSYKNLKESFRDNLKDEVYIGEVKYIDYSSDFVSERGFFIPFLCKRKSFEHERELRAVVWNVDIAKAVDVGREPKEKGMYIKVDLDTLIDKICVAPGVPEWFGELVKSIVQRYGLEKEVVTSQLDRRPLF